MQDVCDPNGMTLRSCRQAEAAEEGTGVVPPLFRISTTPLPPPPSFSPPPHTRLARHEARVDARDVERLVHLEREEAQRARVDAAVCLLEGLWERRDMGGEARQQRSGVRWEGRQGVPAEAARLTARLSAMRPPPAPPSAHLQSAVRLAAVRRPRVKNEAAAEGARLGEPRVRVAQVRRRPRVGCLLQGGMGACAKS